MNLVTHSRSSVGLTNIILNGSTEYFFCSIFTWNYFLLFQWGVLYIWLYYALWFRFDSENGIGCLLRNLLFLFLQLSQSLCTLPFPAIFLRSLYLLVLDSLLWSIQLSYGIDSSTTMILRFTFDKRTISDCRPLLVIVVLVIVMPSW